MLVAEAEFVVVVGAHNVVGVGVELVARSWRGSYLQSWGHCNVDRNGHRQSHWHFQH